MKKNIKVLMVASAIICGFALNPANASGVACVDVQKVVAASSQVKALRTEQEAKTKDLVKFVEKARKDVAEVTDANAKKTLEDKYNKELNEKKTKMDKEYTSKLKIIEDTISNTISKHAKLKDYDVVLSKGVVLYGGTDITEDIIKVVK